MKKLSFNLKATEIAAVSTELLALYAKDPSLAADDVLSATMDEMTSLNNDLIEAIRRSRVLSTLDDADVKRDEVIHAVHFFIQASKFMPEGEERAAAHDLMHIFNKYGLAMCSSNYIAETGLVDSLLGDFALPAVKAKVDKLPGLPAAVLALKAAEDAFDAAKIEFEKAQVESSSKLIATDLKKKMLDLFNGRLVPYLDVMAKSKPDAFLSFQKAVEKMIISANVVAKHKVSKETTSEDEVVPEV